MTTKGKRYDNIGDMRKVVTSILKVTRIPQKDMQRLYDALVSRWKIIISPQEECVLNKIEHFPQTNAFVLLSLKRSVIFFGQIAYTECVQNHDTGDRMMILHHWPMNKSKKEE